jgi:hypothetical protein
MSLSDIKTAKDLTSIRFAPDPEEAKTEIRVEVQKMMDKINEHRATPEVGDIPAPLKGETEGQYLKRAIDCALPYLNQDMQVAVIRSDPIALAHLLPEIEKQVDSEALRPVNSMRYRKPGVLKEVVYEDQSSRTIHEFHGHPNDWMDAYKDPVIRKVSGGSKSLEDTPSDTYSFVKSETNPQIRALLKQAAYEDSAEGRLAKIEADLKRKSA